MSIVTKRLGAMQHSLFHIVRKTRLFSPDSKTSEPPPPCCDDERVDCQQTCLQCTITRLL